MSTVADLAERFHTTWLRAHPFYASIRGIAGYDDLVPDDSEEAEADLRARVEGFLDEARQLEGLGLGSGEAITLGCMTSAARQELAVLDSAVLDHTVTPMPFSGPANLFAVAARTVLPDADAAGDYLTRLSRSGAWLDQQTERLRTGAAKGRYPVAPLVEQALAWVEPLLAPAVPPPLAAPEPPAGWAGTASWREERDRLATELVRPALGRWAGTLRELLPLARPAERAGLLHLPGGAADYLRAVEVHTTLQLTPEKLHEVGLEEVGRLEERAVELGASIGLDGLNEVHAALRASAESRTPAAAIDDALLAIRRAEAHTPELFPEPLAPPCAVSPMPSSVAASGMAPHYTPPRQDGGRPGTFWFNTERPTAGTGWDLEATAFHEGVPGHHLQISRLQLLSHLPAMQRERTFTVFSEGWGLYAEQLAEEVGLYSATESVLGAIALSLMRAVRLVVDTGLHAFGWSRSRAIDFAVAHAPFPPGFLASEVDRYIVLPGQALAYLTGKREILRLRAEAHHELGPRFSLKEFHSTVLGSGSLPMPVLAQRVFEWLSTGQ